MQKYISKLVDLFLHPGKFIKSVSKEKDYWALTKFFAVFYLFVLIIEVILNLLIGLRMGVTLNILNSLGALAIGVVSAFAVPYVSAGLSHAGVWLFGGRQGFFNTFKPAVYGNMLYIIYSLLLLIITGIMQLIMPIYPGMLYNQTYPMVFIIMSGIFVLIGAVFSVYTQTMGVSLFQKISKGKAFLGSILIPLILVIIYLAIIASTLQVL